MKPVFVMAVLIGWLVAEMREFISNDGFANTLAFNILRIVVIICLMVLILSMMIMSNILKINSGYDRSKLSKIYVTNEPTYRIPEKKNKNSRIEIPNNSLNKSY